MTLCDEYGTLALRRYLIMSIAIEEQETVINFRRDSKYADIWTSDTTVMTKLDRKVKDQEEWKCVSVEHLQDGTLAAKSYTCPKKLVSFRGTTHTNSRVYTEEEKKAAAERLRIAREKKRAETHKENVE